MGLSNMDKKDLKALAKNVKGILTDKENRISFFINTDTAIYCGSGKAFLRINKDTSHNYKDLVIAIMGLIGVDLISNIDKPYYLGYTSSSKVFSILEYDKAPLKAIEDLFTKLNGGLVDLLVSDYLRFNNSNHLARIIKLPKGSKAFVDQDVLTVEDIEIYFDNAIIDGLSVKGLPVKANVMNDIKNADINTRPFMIILDGNLSMVVGPMVIK
jgi:hypothetical protein